MWTRPVIGGILAFCFLFLTAALILPRVVCPPDGCSTQAEKTVSDLSGYQSLLDVFHLECGRYPTTEEGLNALHTAPMSLKDKWGPHPYTDRTSFNDSWGNPYQYTSNDPNRYTLKNYGKDGQPGGEGEDADIEVGP